jgi:precorrin-2 dehydrogenase/sirohydrochlorin ferrochelatase
MRNNVEADMRYYPAFLNLNKRPVIVVGGGQVAERKIKGLIRAGADLTVIAPQATKAIQGLASKKRLRLLKRPFKKGDLKGFPLAVCACGSEDTNSEVFKEARKGGVLLNMVDRPELCDFIVPSVVRRGELLIAISSSGRFPYISKAIRKEIEQRFGKEYARFMRILGAIRDKLLKDRGKYGKKDEIFKGLLNSRVPEWLRRGEPHKIDAFLKRSLGGDYTLEKLGISHTER